VLRLGPRRLFALGGLVLLGFLYWRPLHAYFHTKHELDASRAQVQALRTERSHLLARIGQIDSGDALVREARLLSLVKPGERLFIVKGIASWRKHH
jgi:cell division protein FtsB